MSKNQQLTYSSTLPSNYLIYNVVRLCCVVIVSLSRCDNIVPDTLERQAAPQVQ